MNWRDKYLNKIVCGDCLELMPELPDNVADLILTDPPYYKVKGEAWDRQWENPAKYLEWLGRILAEYYRLLKPNGSLYLFASPKMAARVELAVGERFNIIQRICWRKGQYDTKAEMFRKSDLRSFFPVSEYIVFAEHYGADGIAKGESGYGAKCDELRGFVFEPIVKYLRNERENAKLTNEDLDKLCGWETTAFHFFARSGSNFRFPTKENYALLQNAAMGYFRREYEDLRCEYEDLRREFEELRRPFNLTAQNQYTDVWEFPTVKSYPGKHPCEKPAAMIEHMINVSTKPGAVVLDTFAGSGVVAEVAQKLGREFIAIDSSEKYCEIARKRLAQEVLI